MENSTEKKLNDVVGESTKKYGLRFMEDENVYDVISFCRRYHETVEPKLLRDFPKVNSELEEYGLGCNDSNERKELGDHKVGYQQDGLCTKYGINKDKFEERVKLLGNRATKEIGDMLFCNVQLSGDIFVALGSTSSIKSMKILAKDCMVHGIAPASRVKAVKDRILELGNQTSGGSAAMKLFDVARD